MTTKLLNKYYPKEIQNKRDAKFAKTHNTTK